jgi:hypothetical protein
MAQVGNKLNSALNGEWAKHVRRDRKKITSGKRRAKFRSALKKLLAEEVLCFVGSQSH